jgi:hypothetical protein
MSFIDPKEYNISFSDTSHMVRYSNCTFLSDESIESQNNKFIQTEDGLIIQLENSCDVSPADRIECYNLCREGFVDSGSFSIINTCDLPITITGITLSDPERFSLYNSEKYRGTKIYESSSVEELPITIKPRKKISIETFFHPKYEELEFGDAGTLLNRTGSTYGSFVEFYPGFRMSNCDKNGACDARIALTGELLCLQNEDDLSWMYNTDNMDPKFNSEKLLKSKAEIENTSFILKKPTFYQTAQSSSALDVYKGLRDACVGYQEYFDNNYWYDIYSDYGITGSLGAFHDIIEQIINSETNSTLSIENASDNGSLLFTAIDDLGSNGDDISISLLYEQEEDLITESQNHIEIQRENINNEDASILQEEVNLRIENGELNLIKPVELIGQDGQIEEFDEFLSGGIDALSNNLNNLTINDFNKTYIQRSHDYYELITYVTDYKANNVVTLRYQNKTYKGMLFQHSENPNPPEDVSQVPFITNQAMFYRFVGNEIEIFLCDLGDFNKDKIIE